ncbi:hypothetical protein [Acinetobacter faecalis]|uniref:hypothetical protein n=1 Tax=Acinetobacter faecalis TaxID=2665161 RepID=UPI002A91A821|nr:hypothetical protein [Acinetobacter faecalis]MDY6457760.1 hypothetical protein [Acinetobacter faecalis]
MKKLKDHSSEELKQLSPEQAQELIEQENIEFKKQQIKNAKRPQKTYYVVTEGATTKSGGVVQARYNEKFNNLDLRDRELVEKVLKDSLVEVNKIKNNYEREKLQLNIYSALGMHKEAYELNGKMLKDSFSFSRLYTQCILAFSAQRPKSEYEKCYADLAVEMQKELKLPHNNEAEYIAGKWGYLLFMYQAGHKEYEPKLKEMLNTIDDEQLKRQLETGYEVAVEQVKSYEKHSHD